MSTETYDNPPTATTDSKLALITELWQSGPEAWTATTVISQESGVITPVRQTTEMGPTDALIKHFDGLIDCIVDTGTMDAIRATYGQQRRLADAVQYFAGLTNPFDSAAVEATAKLYGVHVADLIDAAWNQLQDGGKPDRPSTWATTPHNRPKQPPVATPAEDTPPTSLLWATPPGDREILTRAAIARQARQRDELQTCIAGLAIRLEWIHNETIDRDRPRDQRIDDNAAAALNILDELTAIVQGIQEVGDINTTRLRRALETVGQNPTQ